MRIKRCPLVFNNVISAKTKCKTDEWYISARDFRNSIIKNGLYATGPVIYKVQNYNKEANEAEYTFYLPVNEPVNMAENDKYSFYENFKFNDGLVLRHADLGEDLGQSYLLIKESAKACGLVLEDDFYNIYLDVYGEGIIDIYAPIVKEA